MTRRFLAGLLAGLFTAGSAWAEFSPLSTLTEGQGLPLAPMGTRERGMGEAGMAALSSDGFFLPNISRSAYYTRTSFTTTLESDLDFLRDNSSATHVATLAIPTVATFIKTAKAGTFGAYYQQIYQRRFNVLRDTASIQEQYETEGGLYLLGLSWAYSPIPLFALGVSYNVLLGHDRFINSASYANVYTTDSVLINSEGLQDTSEMSYLGYYPTFSGTVHTRDIDFALSYTPAVHLNVKQQRTITGILADSIPDTTRALPMSLAGGVAWNISGRQTLALDAYYQDWKASSAGDNFLNPAYKVAMGYEFRGAENPFLDYKKRITYRGGFGYDVLYLQKTPEFYGTLGLGLPLGLRGHVLDLSVKYGHRSSDDGSYFAEDYVKISATLIGVGTWGQPARKHR